ncbi:YjiH family protein [Moritella dasanensis]|uniref:YjiH family protein n=1 Tax=Moritella dasanensis TaxID=428031 RepID=UPI00031053FF|nr:YjiH family protein [Moritella dasanensis]
MKDTNVCAESPQNVNQTSTGNKSLLRFLIPSLIGLFLFMTPMTYEGQMTIPVAILAKALLALLDGYLLNIITTIITFMAVASTLAVLIKPTFITERAFLKELFMPTPLWLIVRLISCAFTIATVFQVGPEYIWNENTGGLVLNDLLPTLFAVFIFAGLLLPLLLNFGLLELCGALCTKIMRPIFNLPGRSAVDCIASWLGDGSVGILLTDKQYQEKFYTQREAAVIGTTFSAVSITFSLVVIAQVNLEQYFLPYYMAITLSGIVAAIIVPKLPPLCWKKDIYIDGTPKNHDLESIPTEHTVFSWGINQAVDRASKVTSYSTVFVEGLKNATHMVFGILPVVMAIGTIGLLIAEYTPIFAILGKPFMYYLEFMNVPEAALASESLVVGFADMFVPSILATSMESDMTRFIIAGVSVSQLIYMSEVGALLLGSKIPVNIVDLFTIFILRTLITLPIITGVAHLIF